VKTRTLERYFDALRSHDWPALAATLAEDVHRTGPYLDVVEGRDAYVAFLSKVLPGLSGYELRVTRMRELEDGELLVLLSEILDVNGVRTEFPEALLFALDADERIARVDVYIKQPPRAAAGGDAG